MFYVDRERFHHILCGHGQGDVVFCQISEESGVHTHGECLHYMRFSRTLTEALTGRSSPDRLTSLIIPSEEWTSTAGWTDV